MEAVTKTIVINRPIDEVFDVATCLKRCVVWRGPIVETEKLTNDPPDVGAEYKHKVKFLGVTVEANPVITVWEAPYRSEFANDNGPIAYHAIFSFEEVDGGTKFTSTIQAEPQGAFKHIPEAFVHKAIMRQHESDLQALKEMMESGIPIVA